MNSTTYSARQLHFCKLQGGSDVDVIFYVNRSIEPVSEFHDLVVEGSEGLAMPAFRAYRSTFYQAHSPEVELLPSTGTVLMVKIEKGFNPTEAICNMAAQWAQVFEVGLWDTFISRRLYEDDPMPVNALYVEGTPIEFFNAFDDELERDFSRSS